MFELTVGEKMAIEAIISGKNVFLTGSAGTGKSFVVSEAIRRLKELKKNVVVAAPTGVAAINVNGSTLHKAFHIPPIPCPAKKRIEVQVPKIIKKADVIIIDEVSMARVDIFDFIAEDLLTEIDSGHQIQLVVCGDFLQLPPVVKKEDRMLLDKFFDYKNKTFAWQSQYWEFFRFKNIVLTEIIRQEDEDFSKSLDQIKLGDIRGLKWINQYSSTSYSEDAITICTTNRESGKINDFKLCEIQRPEHHFDVCIQGDIKDSDLTVDKEGLTVKVGARIMALVNDRDGGYVNGSIGIISEIAYGHICVKFNGSQSPVCIERYTWKKYRYDVKNNKLTMEETGRFTQFPLKLAYAITVHKSQGKTFDQINVGWNFFACGQLYVALSRCRTVNGIHLICGSLAEGELLTDQKNVDFYKKIKREAARN